MPEPTWEAEMLRLHRANGWRHGWREAAAVLAVAALMLWAVT